MKDRKKFFFITTVPLSLRFFKGQIELLNDSFDVHLVSSVSEELNQIADNANVRSHHIEMARDISIIEDLKALFKLILLFLKERPSLIHCNTPKGSFLALLAGFLVNVPHRVYFVHGLRYQGVDGFKKNMLKFIEKVSCFCATEIISVSDGVRKILRHEITAKEVDLIGFGSPNGIDLSFYNPVLFDKAEARTEVGVNAKDFVFGFVGRLVGDKGINELVKSFKLLSIKHKNLKLILIGNYEAMLDPLNDETLIEIETNKDIIHLGFIADIRPYINIFNVFAFPSYREGFGMSLMEANAMSVPAISSNIIGCNEVIVDGVNGFLIEPKDESSLYQRMEYCVSHEEELLAMSSRCRPMIRAKFSQVFVWEKALEKYNFIVSK